MQPHDTTSSDVPLRRCNTCGEEKPATTEYFARDKKSPSGLQYACKACNRLYYRQNKERVAERGRRYRVDDKQKMSQKDRAYRVKNRDKIAQYMQRYYRENKEKLRRYLQGYRAENRGIFNAAHRRRRANKAAATGTHTVTDVKRQYKAQKGRCYYCGVNVGDTYHVDHVVPLSRGGSNGPENIVIACPTCNVSKKDKLPHEWAGSNRLL